MTLARMARPHRPVASIALRPASTPQRAPKPIRNRHQDEPETGSDVLIKAVLFEKRHAVSTVTTLWSGCAQVGRKSGPAATDRPGRGAPRDHRAPSRVRRKKRWSGPHHARSTTPGESSASGSAGPSV